MKSLLIACLLLVSAFPVLAKTKVNKQTNVFREFKAHFDFPAFSDVKLSKTDSLELVASGLYINASSTKRQAYLKEVLQSWKKADNASEQSNDFVTVSWRGGGELWSVKSDKLSSLGQWSDDRLYYSETVPEHGKLFVFFGGQMIQGGGADITGVNARIGSTLYKNKYDIAATFSYASIDTNPSITTNSIGLVGRALYPLSEHVGYNLGGQLVRTDVGGTASITPGVVAGLNFYMPNGSFDVTLSTLDAGRWSLLAGYTIFFNRQ